MKLSNSRTGASIIPVLLVLPVLLPALANAATNVMACAQTKAALVTIWDGASVNSATSLYAFAGTSLPALDAPASNYTAGLSRTYTYAGFLAKGRAATSGELAGKYVFSVKPDASLALVHAQVREAFGFNPLTANPSAFEQGLGVNTKPFTSEDKKAVAAYLKEVYNITAGTLSEKAADSDGDGVPDGWELYVMRNGSPAPWTFADRSSDADADGLSMVREFDAGNSPTDPNDADTDGDGIGDLAAWKYALKGGAADEDTDGDGLSNYAEYLASEVFGFCALDPRKAKTDGVCVDYFRKAGDLYLGELFTDFDQVAYDWESAYADEKSNTGDIWANRRVYDPDKDLDGDGWSNYAEARAGTSPDTPTERPAPVLEATVYCNTAIGPGPVVFRAWNQRLMSRPPRSASSAASPNPTRRAPAAGPTPTSRGRASATCARGFIKSSPTPTGTTTATIRRASPSASCATSTSAGRAASSRSSSPRPRRSSAASTSRPRKTTARPFTANIATRSTSRGRPTRCRGASTFASTATPSTTRCSASVRARSTSTTAS